MTQKMPPCFRWIEAEANFPLKHLFGGNGLTFLFCSYQNFYIFAPNTFSCPEPYFRHFHSFIQSKRYVEIFYAQHSQMFKLSEGVLHGGEIPAEHPHGWDNPHD